MCNYIINLETNFDICMGMSCHVMSQMLQNWLLVRLKKIPVTLL